MEAIRPLLSDYVIDHDVVYQTMLEAFLSFAKDRLSAYGKDVLFDQPEFANDANKIKKLLELFESPEIFREFEDESDDEISIHIGGESSEDDDVSIISAKVKIPGQKEGSIAIVGPKRMDYDRVVSSMEYLVSELEKAYNGELKVQNERKEEKGEGRKETRKDAKPKGKAPRRNQKTSS